jgi:hypothetical protein
MHIGCILINTRHCVCFFCRRAELWAFAAAHNLTVPRVEGYFHRENSKRRKLSLSTAGPSERDTESAANEQYDKAASGDDEEQQQQIALPTFRPPAQTLVAAVLMPARYVVAAPAPLSAHTGSHQSLLRAAPQMQPAAASLLSLASSSAAAADSAPAAAADTTASSNDHAVAAAASSDNAGVAAAATPTAAAESTAASSQDVQVATPGATAVNVQQQPAPVERLTLATAVARAAAAAAAAATVPATQSQSASSGKQRPPWFTAAQTRAVGLKFDEWGGLLCGRKADVAQLAASLGLTVLQINERITTCASYSA